MSGTWARGDTRDESGMVTVELAFAAVFAALLTVALAQLIGVGILQARCHETAAEVARQEARGDGGAVRRALADRPSGAQVEVSRLSGTVTVTVTLVVRPWGELLPAATLQGRATVISEPT